ncbi:MAG: polysaccharide biosynthesis/export family protein [Gemmataceae bacterium]
MVGKPFHHLVATVSAALRAPAIVLVLLGLSGCAAVSNPTYDSVPVRLVPDELLAHSKAGLQTIPLTLLGQPQPEAYRLDHGDVLGIFIDGIVGDRAVPPPLHVAPLTQSKELHRLPPASGYPFPVQADGSVALPFLPKMDVRGMTLNEAREAIRAAYVKKDLLKADNERISVTLLYERQTQVLVMRQEATTYLFGPEGPVPTGKRNSGHLVDLPAYKNDVLHALAQSGGLPEFDAYNEVIIFRGGVMQDRRKLMKKLEKGALPPGDDADFAGEAIRIPLRLPPGSTLPFTREDVLLRPGDTIFLEARDEQVFFTAGLLPVGKYVLPRDQDLDVLEAVSQVHGPLFNGAFGGSNLSGVLIAPGIGNPSPTLLVVVRRVPGRGQMRILVDLRKAVRDPRERILVQPGDMLILQEKPAEAVARYMTQTMLNFEIFWRFLNTSTATGAASIAGPDRVSGRLGSITINQP